MGSPALKLAPISALSGEVTLPGSKSISNRVLLMAAQATGVTRVRNLLRSEDTEHMLRALRQLGVDSKDNEPENGWQTVTGVGGPLGYPDLSLTLDLGLAGTAYRPLVAALCAGQGNYVLDGLPRMHERPVGPLVTALQGLGADIRYLGKANFPPLHVKGTGLRAGRTQIDGQVSSQFLTALLMALPLASGPVSVELSSELVSKPYIDITLSWMRRFGATVEHDDYRVFHASPQGYQAPGELWVEGDASSASYFLAAGAIRGDGITVHGIGSESTQGDVAFIEVLRAMGANVSVESHSVRVTPAATLRGVDLDLNHIPDAAMTLATLALFARGTTHIRNVANWRVKETDRLTAMATELRKLGAEVLEGEDSLSVTPPKQLKPATIATYGDHRIAMCFSLAALGGAPIEIEDPDCVAKTFPDYFSVFDRLVSV